MSVTYTKTTWANGTTPAINATNMNHIETGVYDCATEINTHEADTASHNPPAARLYAYQNIGGAL